MAAYCDMRMVFSPSRLGFNLANIDLPAKVSMPVSVTSSVRGIQAEIFAVSPNSGNMVHAEAPARMFAVDRTHSCFSVWYAAEDGGDASAASPAARFNRLFDGVCLSFANMIRDYSKYPAETVAKHDRNWRRLAAHIDQLEIPVYVFGIGLQDELPAEASSVPGGLLALFQALNRKCRLLAVRGPSTERWMRGVGIDKAIATGCPSLFVYPRNVMAVQAPELTRQSRLASAGRLQRAHGKHDRLKPIRAVAETFRTDYVFQNDFFALARLSPPDQPIFDDATGLVDPVFVREATQKLLGFASPFADHYFFRDTNRWRMFAHLRDAFVGDRFHGGVAFLQAGRPAVILQADARVRELTGFLGIPTMTLDQLDSATVLEAVSRALSPEAIGRFHETYRKRLADFVSICESAGLRFADESAIDAALGRTPREPGTARPDPRRAEAPRRDRPERPQPPARTERPVRPDRPVRPRPLRDPV
jgi:hypothetical protein